MDDEELEFFLNTLEDEDWVIMVGPDGRLKSVMIPNNAQDANLIPESIFEALMALDPDMSSNMEDLQKEMYKSASNDNKFLRLVKTDDDTIH
tara:strand:+ start:6826 stop:7101 length:276 start_codon:yes stop_codon:yes gene_type:complete